MSARPHWSYVQARLQARHGARPDEAGWRVVEGAKSAGHFLERVRATSLDRFAARLDAQMPSHAIERILRAEWRDYVAELSGWVPPEWRQAVLWTRHAAALPILDGVARAAPPQWMHGDPELAAFSEAATGSGSVAARWFAHWCGLWPEGCERERRALDKLVVIVERQVEDLRRADPRETSKRYRQSLARDLVRLFRRRAATPVALFCHLALVALDLERLRGDLIRRSLFQTDGTRRAA